MSTVYLAVLRPGIGRAEDGGVAGWTTSGVADGIDVRCLATDPAGGRTVFAGSNGLGVLRSRDGGVRWEPAGLQGRSVRSLAVGGGYVFAGTRPARPFRSADGGESWEELTSFRRIPSRLFWFSPAEPLAAYVQAIAVSACDPATVVAGIEAGAVVRSPDTGSTWQGHRRGAMRDCHSLAAHARAGWFYEGGWGGGAISSNSGASWSRPDGLDRRYGWAVAADAANPELWYLSAAPGVRAHSDDADAAIYRSHAGSGWERLGGGLPNPLRSMPYALVAGPAPAQLAAGLASGEVWDTRDAGGTWARLDFRFRRIERSLVRLEM